MLSTAFLGIFSGSLIVSLLSAILSYEHLFHFGWRLAYLLGGLLGIIAIYLRIKSVDPSIFLKKNKRAPAIANQTGL